MGMTDVVIRGGETFLTTGERLPTGGIVQTEGGLFQMTEQGGQRTDLPALQQLMQGELQGQMTDLQGQFSEIYQQAMLEYQNQLTEFYGQYQSQMQGIIDQVMNIPAYESPYIGEIQQALQNVQQQFQYAHTSCVKNKHASRGLYNQPQGDEHNPQVAQEVLLDWETANQDELTIFKAMAKQHNFNAMADYGENLVRKGFSRFLVQKLMTAAMHGIKL